MIHKPCCISLVCNVVLDVVAFGSAFLVETRTLTVEMLGSGLTCSYMEELFVSGWESVGTVKTYVLQQKIEPMAPFWLRYENSDES